MSNRVEIQAARFVRLGSVASASTILESKQSTATGETTVFDNLNWTWRHGETWAIVGSVASGKSSFLDVLLGQLRCTQGSIRWPIVDQLRAEGANIRWPNEIMERVSFAENSRTFTYKDHYYQQRFDFSGESIILQDYLTNQRNIPGERFQQVCQQFQLEELLPRTLLQLSNGQTRRARLARAMLAEPKILLLDEPLIGLDAQTRPQLNQLLRQLVQAGQALVITCKPDHIPDWVTNILDLDQLRPAVFSQSAQVAAGLSGSPALAERPLVIDCQNVKVSYAGKVVLQGIDWKIHMGERWALVGPNGSGKSTLLALLVGDHPQVFSNEIRLFGKKRGSGETIWDIKKRIGYISPEFHLYFSEPLTAFEAASTGFHDVIIYRPITTAQESKLQSLFQHFQLTHLSDKPFRQLSTGEQRMILLMRALAKDAELLVLDEPFQSLDTPRVNALHQWLEDLPASTTVILVTHDSREIPASFRLRKELSAPQI